MRGGEEMQLTFLDDMLIMKLNQYETTEQQLQFTMAPIKAVELAAVDVERDAVVLLNDQQDIVTFFVLHRGSGVKPFSTNDYAILLRAFSTDNRFIGKGYAKAALKLLPIFIQEHYPDVNEIVLAVDEGNIAAETLYKKLNYQYTNRTQSGRNGKLYIYSYKL